MRTIDADELKAKITVALGGNNKIYVCGLIDDAPTVSAEPKRWIPCSERMPENFNYVIAAGSDGIGIVRYNGTLFADDSGAIYTISAFTHWMPLPPEPESEVQDDAADN